MKYLFTGYTAGKAQNTEFQCRAIGLISFIAVPIALIFSVVNFSHDRIALAMVEVVAVFLFAACLFLSRHANRLTLSRNLLLVTSFLLFIALFVDGGVAHDGMNWSLLVPFLAMLLLGLPRAWFWLLGYLCIIMCLVVGHFFDYYHLPYADDFVLYFPSMYIVSALFAAAFEAQFERLHVRYEHTITELQALRDNLEQKVEERTVVSEQSNIELREEVSKHKKTLRALKDSEERFFQAQKMETIGTLVGGIAHDFNNMLAGINANLFMIKRKTKEHQDVQTRAGDIEQLVMRASDMIKQLLTFARKDHVELVQVDMCAFMQEAFKLAEVSISEKIHIELENPADVLPIQANTTQLQQVLMNMVNNARDAVKQVDNPTIVVKVERYVPSERFQRKNPELTALAYATLTVIDNGIGIATEDLDKIFEPFYSTKEVGKGTGLGLAMCFGAVQSHGGTIKVQSELGKGTGFKVYIPIAEGEVFHQTFDDSGTVPVGLGETILLVDDEEVLRESQKEALLALGYQVLEAKHGKEAVALFAAHHEEISLVVTDVTMPVMGGVRAANEIRAIKPNVPIIFVTGYDKDNTLDEIPNLDECMLDKPFTMDKLNKVIQQQLRSI